jgi:hypothetical protein
MTNRPPREDRLLAAVWALNGILPGYACYTTEDGREMVGFGTVSVVIAEMAGRVVDQLAMLEDKWEPTLTCSACGNGIDAGAAEFDLGDGRIGLPHHAACDL